MKNLFKAHQTTVSRRQFLAAAGCCGGAAALSSCAVNPVTGQNQFMFYSKQEEIAMDQQRAPYQFSSDYGVYQNDAINRYIAGVGQKIAKISHRPDMSYSFRAVNANYVNAYAFPGGSIALTRGILVRMGSEAELAALLGHEVGHVTARHTSSRMSKGTLLNGAVVLGSVLLQGAGYDGLAQPAQQLGGLGSQLLLADYSRDDERQSDDLGMEYMVKAGYNPQGMVDLTELLLSMQEGATEAAQSLFASHPMSSERNTTAIRELNQNYAQYKSLPMYRERFMDNMAPLMRIKSAVIDFGNATMALAQQNATEAESLAERGLRVSPNDYSGLLILSQAEMSQNKWNEAESHLAQAQRAYPQEAQSYFLTAIAKLEMKKPDEAIEQLKGYDSKLPGNPYVLFYAGYAYEIKGSKEAAAQQYRQFLQSVASGQHAEYAYGRLVEWGYIQ
ncbi:MAG: M48 family metalloprotease [Pseudomonadota bacterium]|nr:M48 family metalloprotease [Pseudomonadota bacterium]